MLTASPWDLVAGLLAAAAALLLASWLIWRHHRSAGEPDRLIPFLHIGAVSIPILTLWLAWLLGRFAPLAARERWLVAFALAWVLTPFTALALNAIAERLGGRNP
jgi:hypothetical protein